MTEPAPSAAGPERAASAASTSSADEAIARAERRVVDRQHVVDGVDKERGNLRVFPILSAVLPLPVFFVADWKIALFVFACCWLFYAAGRYLNFMHIRNARQDLDAARAELERQTKKRAGAR